MLNAKKNKQNNTSNKPKKVELDKNNEVFKSRVVEVSLTSKQINKINDWIAATRKIWNLSLQYINKNRKQKFSSNNVRDLFVTRKNMCKRLEKQIEWTFRTPKRIREYAVKDLFSCIQSTKTRYFKNKKLYELKKLKKKPRKPKINSKSKYSKKQTISLPKESSYIFNKTKTVNGIETEYSVLRVCSEDIILKEKFEPTKNLSSNMRLSRVGFNYFISIPIKTNIIEQKNSKDKMCSIDPGENIPWTYYDPTGEYGFIGLGLKEKIYSIYSKIESLKSKNKRNKSIKKQERKIINLVDDLQWKVCHWLLSRYNKIIIPRLYVSNCSKIRKQLQADMRHCTFVDRLIGKSISYKNTEIHCCKEHGTSMTCTNCGSTNTVKDVTVRCSDCNFEIHRDLSGARNIMVKHLN